MPKLPRPTGKDMHAFLVGLGFEIVRIRGSHHVMRKGSLRTIVPVHRNKTLKIGTLRGILRDIRKSAEEFADLWNG